VTVKTGDAGMQLNATQLNGSNESIKRFVKQLQKLRKCQNCRETPEL